MHRHLNKEDRACIALLLRRKYSYNEIAKVVGVDHTTISREIKRNSDSEGRYDARLAEKKARKRRYGSRIRYRLIDTNPDLERLIITKLEDDWSPDQIVRRRGVSSVSSVYRYLERHPYLKQYLRRAGRRRRRYGTKRIPSRYQANKRSIHERPPIRSIGHWEGDTILGSERKLRIVTYVDTLSGYLVAAKVPGGADSIHEKAKQQFKELPCSSITYDNGSEFALHQLIERDTKAKVYFADPGKPNQRGANENVNGLLRQYFPKGSSFATITDSDVKRAVTRLNNRPRKRLNYLTPREYLEREGVRFR
jgi:transposase, IS30 family